MSSLSKQFAADCQYNPRCCHGVCNIPHNNSTSLFLDEPRHGTVILKRRFRPSGGIDTRSTCGAVLAPGSDSGFGDISGRHDMVSSDRLAVVYPESASFTLDKC
ncbi:hypothetical protein NP493_492g01043 [Ridgeia piscesae]|uniref:Uncharacterized protein n=1 Tax=Ridgeia piscesae TaxID=27915 RepID=A0AAD9NU19_RIDPI|nr:hypothetical protein NP493_492g01043 [Ridgeia piscesae]